jgi:enoyl-CoA hydratase/carnithine racemase
MSDAATLNDDTGILYQVDSGVAQITFNRPEKLNALTPAMLGVFFEKVDAAAINPQVRVIVITGAGRGFSAGLDLSVIGSSKPGEGGGDVVGRLGAQIGGRAQRAEAVLARRRAAPGTCSSTCCHMKRW